MIARRRPRWWCSSRAWAAAGRQRFFPPLHFGHHFPVGPEFFDGAAPDPFRLAFEVVVACCPAAVPVNVLDEFD